MLRPEVGGESLRDNGNLPAGGVGGTSKAQGEPVRRSEPAGSWVYCRHTPDLHLNWYTEDMRLVVCLVALISVVVGGPAFAPHPALAQSAPAAASAMDKGAPRSITMDFQDVDIAALVKFISEVTGKNFILTDRVHGKLTIVSPTKMSAEEAYAVFQSALQLKGFTTVPAGAVIKIVPSKDAKSSSIETVLPR
jgi:methionine-rich copper-binding protein CopC